jgi:hypothetical protein
MKQQERKIEKFERRHVTMIREEIDAALADLSEQHGISINAGNATYSDNTITFKLELQIEGFDPLKDAFEKSSEWFGLKPEDYGREFVKGVRLYKIVGLKPRNRKYPIICQDMKTGKHYKLPEAAVQAALAS